MIVVLCLDWEEKAELLVSGVKFAPWEVGPLNIR